MVLRPSIRWGQVLGIESGPAFVALMRRYVVDYTNRHDQDLTPELMEPDYLLCMGEHRVLGRDGPYRAATAKQMSQFPGLGLTVHRIATSGDGLVMHFSEHGASRLHRGRRCAWGGIGLYRWNGRKLVQNFVEQDYFSRRQQLAGNFVNPVYHPAIAPWDTAAAAPDPTAEAVVREWLASGRLATTPGVICDDHWVDGEVEPLVEQTGLELNEFFSCGQVVGFHATQYGRLLPGDGIDGRRDMPIMLHLAGYVDVVDGAVRSGQIIRNRLDLLRRLRQAAA